MAQTIRYMSKATGVTPAASHTAGGTGAGVDADGTAQPKQGTIPAATATQENQTVTVRSKLALTVALDPMAANDIYVAFPLPARHEIVDAKILSDDIETGGPTLTLTMAQLFQDFTDIVTGTSIITASTVGQAGGVARADTAAGLEVAATDYDRWYGLKVIGANTAIAAGNLYVEIQYRAFNG